jgi:Na+-translocating ferredoxin:NAD+ oxidoreductase subunit G
MSNRTNVGEPLKIYGVVLGVGIVCSVSIASVYEATRPIIARNQIALRQAAILDVLPTAATVTAFRLEVSTDQFKQVSPDEEGDNLVFAGFDPNGQLVGFAIETRGMGYQDFIRLLYGYSTDAKAVIGIRVLASRETPGLGDRIETDTAFLANFKQLDVRLNEDGTQLAHPIEFVKPSTRTEAWQVDGITGATISSRATALMIGESAAHWIPHIESRRHDFTLATGKEQ